MELLDRFKANVGDAQQFDAALQRELAALEVRALRGGASAKRLGWDGHLVSSELRPLAQSASCSSLLLRGLGGRGGACICHWSAPQGFKPSGGGSARLGGAQLYQSPALLILGPWSAASAQALWRLVRPDAGMQACDGTTLAGCLQQSRVP